MNSVLLSLHNIDGRNSKSETENVTWERYVIKMQPQNEARQLIGADSSLFFAIFRWSNSSPAQTPT